MSVFVEMDPALTPSHAFAARARVRSVIASFGARVHYEYKLLPNLLNLRNVGEAALHELAALPGVLRIVRDHPVQAHLNKSVPLIRGAHSQLDQAGLPASGFSARICIIDSGINSGHPFFAPGQIDMAAGWDFVNDDADPTDDAGHGTHMAGIAAGSTGLTRDYCQVAEPLQGVAHAATLIAVKVLTATGHGSGSDVVAAIERCASPDLPGGRADVINLSLGYGAFSGTCDGIDIQVQAANAAAAAGVVVVASAGNDGQANALASPACASQVIAVGGTYATEFPNCQYPPQESFTWSAGCTDTFPRVDDRICASNASSELDVVAPGCWIFSAYIEGPGIGQSVGLRGTSPAAPHVAGLAALILDAAPWLTPAQVRHAIRHGAIDLGPSGFDPQFGYGRIDVLNSLALVDGLIEGSQCATDADCDDDSACNGVESCDTVLGCRSGASLDCDDGYACTTDGCDAEAGCYHQTDDTACGDGDPCNGIERCSLLGCEAGSPLADGESCSDSDVCNGSETCSAGSCVAGVPLPDADADGACDEIDVCPGVHDPGQADEDSDGAGDACDCAPQASDTWAVPEDAKTLMLFQEAGASGATLLGWDPPDAPGGLVIGYDVVRSGTRDGWLEPAQTVCLESNDATDTEAVESYSPRPGQAFYFLTVARNGCGRSIVGVRDCP